MSVAKTIEIVASSPTSFDAAVKEGISRANTTLEQIKGAWVQDQEVSVENGQIVEYKVRLRVTFVLK
jgi:flavin-binding protein dodecin